MLRRIDRRCPHARLDPVDDLGRVGQPSLLVWGQRDPFGAVEAGRAMAAALPDARFQLVDGGHAPWLDEPERIGEVAGPFLGRAAGTA